jgi:hypothetical protein
MKDATKAPGRGGKTTVELRKGDDRHTQRHGGEIPLPTLQDQTWNLTTPRPWPFAPSDSTPVTWWRRLPAQAFRDQERAQIGEMLRHVDVLRGGDELRAAMNGDAAAAIATALSMMPIENIDLHTDITMTSLLRCALNGDAAAALVLAQIVGLTDVDHSLTRELSVSWIAWGFRHSTDPKKFGEAGAVVLSALKAHESGAEDE